MEENYTNHPNPSFMKGGDYEMEGRWGGREVEGGEYEMEENYTNHPNPSFVKGGDYEMENRKEG